MLKPTKDDLVCLIKEFENSVIEWREEQRGPDGDYVQHAKAQKEKARTRLLMAFDKLMK